jgi:hypothetical protein
MGRRIKAPAVPVCPKYLIKDFMYIPVCTALQFPAAAILIYILYRIGTDKHTYT